MCPFLQDFEDEVYYLLSNGTMLLRCANNGDQVLAECGINGEWNKIGISCSNSSDTTSK